MFFFSICLRTYWPMYYVKHVLCDFSTNLSQIDCRMCYIVQDYFSDCTETIIKENYVVVYELLDEMLDNGYPLATESNILKELIRPPNILRTIANTVTGKSKLVNIFTLPLSNVLLFTYQIKQLYTASVAHSQRGNYPTYLGAGPASSTQTTRLTSTSSKKWTPLSTKPEPRCSPRFKDMFVAIKHAPPSI